MITLTDAAAHHLHLLLQEKQVSENCGLRIQVEKGGCAGWQYTMKIDQAQETDRQFAHRGVFIIVDPQSFEFLSQSTIDYTESLNESGFRVINPNAARNCGCGTSFEPKAA